MLGSLWEFPRARLRLQTVIIIISNHPHHQPFWFPSSLQISSHNMRAGVGGGQLWQGLESRGWRHLRLRGNNSCRRQRGQGKCFLSICILTTIFKVWKNDFACFWSELCPLLPVSSRNQVFSQDKKCQREKTNAIAIANCADINAVLCISACFEAALQLSLWNKEDF